MLYRRVSALIVCVVVFAAVPIAHATLIVDADIVAVPQHVVESGNGLLDLILFGFAGGGGVNTNSAGSFNGDNANTEMPNGVQTSTLTGSYITSIGEIRDFYELTFPDGSGGSLAKEILLFVDVNETGSVNDFKVQDIQIVLNYTANFGDDRNNPAAADIGSVLQNSTGSGFSGGTVLAELDPNISPRSLPIVSQGASFADHMIFTGVNPFDSQFADGDRILFFWDSIEHDNGGDKVFLSGSYIPEPSSMVLLAIGGLAVLARRRRR